jgi:hypothetical protein
MKNKEFPDSSTKTDHQWELQFLRSVRSFAVKAG